MSSQENSSKQPRLVDQIEIEVIRDPLTQPQGHQTPTSYEANPLHALEEIVERLEELERNAEGSETIDRNTSDQQRTALSDMERHLEQFQKQSAILKRVLMKLH